MGIEILPIGPRTAVALPTVQRNTLPRPEPEAPLDQTTRPEASFVSFQFHLERLTADKIGESFRFESVDLSLQARGIEALGLLEKLQEFFSPERTADRIASFAIKGFSSTSYGREDTAETRQNFVEFITPFIRQGFDEALSLFESFEDVVREPAEETFEKVRERLDAFVKGEA